MDPMARDHQNHTINLSVAQACEDICHDLGGSYSEDRIAYDHHELLPNSFTIELNDGRRIVITVEG